MKLDYSISAVVTGGASGLGASAARMLAPHGVKVAIFDVNEDLGEAFAHEIGGVFCKADVTLTPAVGRLRQGARRERTGAHSRQLRRNRQQRQERIARQGDWRDQGTSARKFRAHY
jgi:NAD(P)-dependent dehydrogenase (short-subunit alcohol dehydrogenase family)